MYIYGGMRIYTCRCICVGTHMDLYVYLHMYLCIYVCRSIRVRVSIIASNLYAYFKYTGARFIFVHTYVCMCICIYMRICVRTHT